jgi:hypothetical protein
MSRFTDAGPLRAIAINLFHGYGYNFYRTENQLRADDQRARALASGLLTRARASLDQAESTWRRERMPAPTRAAPFPDSAAIAGAQALERMSRAIGTLEGQVRSQPVPENDRMTERYRQEAATLEALGEKDALLVGQAETLRVLVEGASGDTALAIAGEIEKGLTAIGETLRQRQSLLL